VTTMTAEPAARPRPVRGGTASWACNPGFPPSTIFPFTPPERMGIRNLFEFQTLMYRPLYWLGRDGEPGVDYALSPAEPPEWSEDGLSVTVTVKPWQWSNGETMCADNVMFWLNMMVVKSSRYGGYSPGYLPDNLASYEKVAENQVRLTFDKRYSPDWVLMNQLTLITPMPRAWDRTAHDRPANASADLADVPAVYDYLVAQNGAWTDEDNRLRTTWPDSPVWSVVSGPWRLRSFDLDGTVVFRPNERYSGPNKPRLDEFRLVPMESDEVEYARLKAGPHGPDAIQVGYLPYGLDTGAADGSGSASAGGNPLAGDYRLVPQNVFLINYMPLNFENPTVAGRIIRQTYFRQALQHTLDQDTAIREIFHGYGYRTTGPVPTVPDNKYVSPAQRGGEPLPFDIGRARELLRENGWDVSTTPAVCVRPGSGPGEAGEGVEAGDKLSFSLRYIAGRTSLTLLMRQFKADAAAAGIELRLEEVYGSAMVAQDHAEAGADNPRLWEIQCWNGGWVFYGQPTGEVLFKTGAGSNYGKYSDPAADELIERTVAGGGTEALHAYQDYLAEQVPTVWAPGFPLRVFAVAEHLHGVEPVNPYGMLMPENWYYTAP
jgi:peptide/nickel transport system substrate-binding protein